MISINSACIWFKQQGLRPRVVGEFDDSALAQEFGRQGVGYYLGPDVLADEIQSRLQVDRVGTIDAVEEHFHAISIQRRITHPCVLAITRAGRNDLFQSPPESPSTDTQDSTPRRPPGARPPRHRYSNE